jgi:hypothetical protein
MQTEFLTLVAILGSQSTVAPSELTIALFTNSHFTLPQPQGVSNSVKITISFLFVILGIGTTLATPLSAIR